MVDSSQRGYGTVEQVEPPEAGWLAKTSSPDACSKILMSSRSKSVRLYQLQQHSIADI
jgi:hypothetical protein